MPQALSVEPNYQSDLAEKSDATEAAVINMDRTPYRAETARITTSYSSNEQITTPAQGATMPDPTREEIDARFRAASAETDKKFAEVLGEVRLISSELKGEMGKINTRLDGVERSTGGVKATIVASVFFGIAIVIAVLGYGQQWFGIGITTRDTIRATIKEMQEPPLLPRPPSAPNTR
jgi:hypothetical protein